MVVLENLFLMKNEVVKKFGTDPVFSSKGNKKDRKKQKSFEKKFFQIFCSLLFFV